MESRDIELRAICELGSRDYFEKRGKYQNPYPQGTPEFNQFERGWVQSLKRNEGKLVNSEGYLPYAKYNFSESARNVPSDIEIQTERYRARKG